MRIEYIRDGLAEEVHCAGFIQFTTYTSGEDKHPFYLRSCAKPLQASLLIDYGANLSEEEFALICGSHAGEDCHVEIAEKLLRGEFIENNHTICVDYKDDNITSSNSKYFKDIETIDDNTVKITFKDVEYGEDEEVKAEKTIEYIIHKHIQDDENIVVPVAIH